jgi:N-acyl homoserine lactone hydrolase
MDDGEILLIDAGWPESFCRNPSRAFADHGVAGLLEPVDLTANHILPTQLARAGLTVDHLDLLVLTHSDNDHMGGIDFVPASIPVVVARAERELETPGAIAPLKRPWPDRDYHLVEGDTNLRPGIELIATPGHSPGHLSVLVRLPETGAVLLTIDALPRAGATKPDGVIDVAAANTSLRRLRGIRDRERALVIYGHDLVRFRGLRLAPDFYL